MKYLSELRVNWRALAAACLGLSSGYLLFSYLNNNFVPHLLQEFGWSKSLLSLTGVAVLLPAICLPIVGRLTDRYGVRRVALIGVIGAPLTFIALSAMTGSFVQYFLIMAVQSLVVGGTTTSLVYSRPIAERFNLARGIALGIVACSPAVVGAASAPILSNFIDAHGWRAGYLAVAAYTAVAGAIALLLIPSGRAEIGHGGKAVHPFALRDYAPILRSRSFQIIAVGMLLCNLPYIMNGSQLKLILLARAMSSPDASWMISLYAAGVIVGRLACGLALDRFPPQRVAAVALGLPGIGLFILTSGAESRLLLSIAVSLLGLSLGAEADIIAYLSMRFFQVEIYSTVVGMVATAAAISAALGSLLLSLTLNMTGSFGAFLLLSAVSTVVGGALFLRLGRPSVRAADAQGDSLSPSA